MKIEKVDQNTIVEVGKFYMVRHAEMKNEYSVIFYMPIIGELHKDIQFGQDIFHYHIDGRFTDNKNYWHRERFNVDCDGKTSHIAYDGRDEFKMTVVWKRRKCKRLTTGIKPFTEEGKIPERWYQWYSTMIGKSCEGKKCPHLGHTMFEEDGKWICPLHRLIGDPETKKIIANVF